MSEVKFTCAAHGNPASCEECAEADRAAFAKASEWICYVEGKKIVNFGGHELAKVTSVKTKRRRPVPNRASPETWLPVYIQAQGWNGSEWYGLMNGDGGGIITLHRRQPR